MKLYLRILAYLRPHTGVFAAAVACTFVFAALDAAAFVLLIPFVETLFSEHGGGESVGWKARPGPSGLRRSARIRI